MPKTTITGQLKNFEELVDKINAINGAGRQAISDTLKDVKVRAPGWIASEVVKVYNIKKSEITPSSGNKPKRLAGYIKASGDTFEDFAITYTGRLLTPIHFGMTPKVPPHGKNYTLKAQFLKGSKKIIGRYKAKRKPGGPYAKRSHNILMFTGNKREGGVNYIPFQRMSERRTDLKKFTTLSVPQMVTSERTNEAIMAKLNEETEKRLNHHLERVLGR